MVTDARTDARTDAQRKSLNGGYIIIPRSFYVAGYRNHLPRIAPLQNFTRIDPLQNHTRIDPLQNHYTVKPV